MTPSLFAWHQRLGRLGILAKAAVLCGALLIALGIALGIAFSLGGNPAAIAALAAWGICLVAGLKGLAIAEWSRRRSGISKNSASQNIASENSIDSGTLASSATGSHAFNGMLLGMFVRMGLPLLLLLALVVKSHPLLDAGFAFYLIGFYQVMLLMEVLLITQPAETRTLASTQES